MVRRDSRDDSRGTSRDSRGPRGGQSLILRPRKEERRRDGRSRKGRERGDSRDSRPRATRSRPGRGRSDSRGSCSREPRNGQSEHDQSKGAPRAQESKGPRNNARAQPGENKDGGKDAVDNPDVNNGGSEARKPDAGMFRDDMCFASTCTSAADLRFVQVWNLTPDAVKKPLQWFVKKAGGSGKDMAPVGAQLVMVKSTSANADVQMAVLETKAIPQAEALVAAIEKWKVGIPKMKAKVISEDDFVNLLEKSTTCLVFVKNVPEDIEDEDDIKRMGTDIAKAQIGHHPQHGRYALIEAKSHEAAVACVDVFNIPHSGGTMTAELTTAYQKQQIVKASSQKASMQQNSQRRRSRSRRR